ncbi:MAG: hypothetical protein JSV80_11195 [Acidobacteriota bacterium]|nr:MAG: hypothetical protein JSV80_11195 [Acidobacteriota bacterium]
MRRSMTLALTLFLAASLPALASLPSEAAGPLSLDLVRLVTSVLVGHWQPATPEAVASYDPRIDGHFGTNTIGTETDTDPGPIQVRPPDRRSPDGGAEGPEPWPVGRVKRWDP